MENKILSIENPVKIKEHGEDCQHCAGFGFFDDVSDWASGAWESVTSSWEWAKNVGSQFWDDAVEIYNAGEDAVKEKIREARNWVDKLKKKQAEVDKIIKATKDPGEKQALIEKRDEARGIFHEYVLPAFEELMGKKKELEKEYDANLGSMGAFPLIPITAGIAIVSVAMAVIYYAKKSYGLEDEIVNDSSLSSTEKARLISEVRQTGNIQSIAASVQDLKWPMIIGGFALVAYSLFK